MRKIKAILKNISLIALLSIAAPCSLPTENETINQISNDKVKTYRDSTYQYIEFIDRKTYKTPIKLHDLYLENRNQIPHNYQKALDEISTIEFALEIIDKNKDQEISWGEAIKAFFSKETALELEELLDSQIKITMLSQ